MNIRLTPLRLVVFVLPILLVLVSLVVHGHYWVEAGKAQIEPAVSLLGIFVLLVGGLVLSYSTLVHEMLSNSFWYKAHFVRSNAGQASVALVLIRGFCLGCLWLVAIIAIGGNFS